MIGKWCKHRLRQLLSSTNGTFMANMNETPIKKRRCSALDQLKPNWRDERYAAISQTKEWWQVAKGVEVTPQKIHSKHHRSLNANIERWTREVFNFRLDGDIPLHFDDAEVERYQGFYDERRMAIKYLFFAVFGAPDEDQWHNMKIIPAICHLLCIPKSSYYSVKQILQQITLTMEAYSVNRAQNAGSKDAIVHGTAQSNIIYDALSNNLTVTDTANVVNSTVVH